MKKILCFGALIVIGCGPRAAAVPPTVPAVPAAGAAPTDAATAQPVAATSKAKTPPNPCETESEYRQFDFWLGDWVVSDENGVKQGDNRITKAEADCLIIERWTSTKGTTGQSYNFYDPVRGKWRQVWVSRGMVIDYEGGLREDGAMVLVGEIHYHSGGKFPFRGAWTPLEDGSVRQHFEQQDDKTGEWKKWFTGIYRRRTSASSG